MKIIYFVQSLVSCWNNGHAHFLRGVLRELAARGHTIRAYEPSNGWSRTNLIAEHGQQVLHSFHQCFPELSPTEYGPDFDLEQALTGADLVIVHEWNDPSLVAKVGRLRSRGAKFLLLFHDTHHRAISDPAAMRNYDLSGYDGVLAFGQALAEIYRKWGWGDRAFIWHEAADTRLFRPPETEERRRGLVWVGNWGDEERTAELHDYLFAPVARMRAPLDVYGVRYPEQAVAQLHGLGIAYQGWLPNNAVPKVFAAHQATVHVPRRYYAEALAGIPTIRVFEALACGIPLISAPWEDVEALFRAGDFLIARSPPEMEQHLRAVLQDSKLRVHLAERGLATIKARHTCGHRADELLAITRRIRAPAKESVL
ncbi:MAG: glycosyltransferase [Acetobacteraceae bacterium]|nr:glycosyltransferase [Acetobacteraceae bacterium]